MTDTNEQHPPPTQTREGTHYIIEHAGEVRIARCEVDGQDFAPWVLRGEIDPEATLRRLTTIAQNGPSVLSVEVVHQQAPERNLGAWVPLADAELPTLRDALAQLLKSLDEDRP